MNYVYIIVPMCFSLLLFTLTVGYLLLVKYKASRLLESIRRDMIMKHCSPEFVSKAPDVTYGHVPFTGVYREPSMSMVQQACVQSQPLHMLSGSGGFDSVHTLDANSDVIEVPLRPYVHHSSSSSEGMGGIYYGRIAYHNRHKTIEEGGSGIGVEGGRDTPLEYPQHQFVDEFGPATAYSHQEYQNELPKLR
ncbi:unnamed protein product [Taenia asiatica]|uniref:Secreted protein n=1 Tax=Taenia asiatica TaxID=60517 RepID=A0A0R3VZS7_TAEAS|nr:unnamed protein product [Taenia asiatica]